MSEFALLTKSYAKDLPYCRTLCKSIDRLFPDIPHYLVIDRWDRRLFREFRREGRTIIHTESLLPEFLLVPRGKGRRTWISPYRLRPVGGWFIQQLAKITAVSRMSHRAVVVADSDVEFVRPLSPDMLFQDGKTRMLRYSLQQARPFHLRWNEVSRELLGISGETPKDMNYVENIVVWHPEVVRAMIAHLKSLHGSWKRALLRYNTMSEYYYYGMFVDHVPGPHRDMVFADSRKLCYSLLYDFDGDPEDAEQGFADGFTRDYVGFGIQSNIEMPLDRRERLSGKLRQAYAGLKD